MLPLSAAVYDWYTGFTMRILLIDNGTRGLEALLALCDKHDVTTIVPGQLESTATAGFDSLILAGSYDQKPVWEQQYFMPQAALVQENEKPVLGIGLGFELICYTYGCQLHEVAGRQAAATKLTPSDDGAKLFQGTDPLVVSDAPRWNVDDLPKALVVLASSESGVEAVRHKTKPVYGLQLLPADFKYGSDAKMVYQNILETFRRIIEA